jgi:hypothetical protein
VENPEIIPVGECLQEKWNLVVPLHCAGEAMLTEFCQSGRLSSSVVQYS